MCDSADLVKFWRRVSELFLGKSNVAVTCHSTTRNNAVGPPAEDMRRRHFCHKFGVFRDTGVTGLARGLATLPQGVHPGAFSGHRHGWKTRRTPRRCTASVYAEMLYCWGSRSLESAVPWNVNFCLSCPRFLFIVFILQCYFYYGNLIVLCILFFCFQCVCCFGLVASTCQVLG